MSQYSENEFIESDNHSWGLLFKYVEDGSAVLDVGCSSGTFGAVLRKEKHCTVDGIELFHEDAQLAKKKLRKVYELNVESDDLAIIKTQYDYIIFADVIEHLVDPSTVLERMKKLLKPGGSLLYSIPNMSHLSIRLALLEGNFDHTETGLIDKTHLHFYTGKQIERVFSKAGFTITDQRYTHVVYPEMYIENRLNKLGLSIKNKGAFAKLIKNKDAQAFQYIGSASASALAGRHAPITKLPHQKDLQEINKLLEERMSIIEELQEMVRNENVRYAQLAKKIEDIESSKTFRTLRKVRSIYTKPKHDRNR